MTNLSAIPYTVSKKGHMIWQVIVLNNNILIYSFIFRNSYFNDLFSYCPSKKRSYLSALPPVCDIVDAERNGELCNHSWPMSPLTVIQYRTTCTDWIMLPVEIVLLYINTLRKGRVAFTQIKWITICDEFYKLLITNASSNKTWEKS